MDNIPIIRVEIDGMKDTITHAMMSRSKEWGTMISDAIDKSFDVKTIQHKIDMQVAKALDSAIDTIAEHYLVKSLVHDIVVASLTKKRDEMERLNES